MLFCFQWLLVCFKREFAWDDVLVMWDVLFSKYLSEDFTVFVCTAMIGDLRAPIMEGNLKNDEILHVSKGGEGRTRRQRRQGRQGTKETKGR